VLSLLGYHGAARKSADINCPALPTRVFEDNVLYISKSKMISRQQGVSSGGVYFNTLRKPTKLPTKIAL